MPFTDNNITSSLYIHDILISIKPVRVSQPGMPGGSHISGGWAQH